MSVSVHLANMLEWLTAYGGPPFDSCVTDPPYHLQSITKRWSNTPRTESTMPKSAPHARASAGFMGKKWDGGDIAFQPETWLAVFAALKPGAHLVAFSGTRTYHRMVCAIEDAGFEIRDQLAWTFGSGFPKSHDVSKALDRAAGAQRAVIAAGKPVKRMIPGADQARQGWEKNNGREFVPTETAAATDEARQWEGWGTALKPAWEPICLARKPLSEKSVAANVLRWGTGAINISACRVGTGDGGQREGEASAVRRYAREGVTNFAAMPGPRGGDAKGRFPANLIHDGSDEVLAAFPAAPGQQYAVKGTEPSSPFANVYGDMPNRAGSAEPRGDTGSAARFFYSAKAGPLDRIGSAHATVKPVDLMRWLSRLITPPGGLILDPFAGSGTTGIAAMAEGFGCTMLDIEAEHVADIERKLAFLRGEGAMSFVEHDRKRDEPQRDAGPLFGTAAA